MKSIEEINKIVQNHERRISALEKPRVKKNTVVPLGIKSRYKPGSTIEKILSLISAKFFDRPRTIKNIISELKNKDIHMKASDLTLPLRKIVRKDLLKRTKENADGSASKNWLYVKV